MCFQVFDLKRLKQLIRASGRFAPGTLTLMTVPLILASTSDHFLHDLKKEKYIITN